MKILGNWTGAKGKSIPANHFLYYFFGHELNNPIKRFISRSKTLQKIKIKIKAGAKKKFRGQQWQDHLINVLKRLKLIPIAGQDDFQRY